MHKAPSYVVDNLKILRSLCLVNGHWSVKWVNVTMKVATVTKSISNKWRHALSSHNRSRPHQSGLSRRDLPQICRALLSHTGLPSSGALAPWVTEDSEAACLRCWVSFQAVCLSVTWPDPTAQPSSTSTLTNVTLPTPYCFTSDHLSCTANLLSSCCLCKHHSRLQHPDPFA